MTTEVAGLSDDIWAALVNTKSVEFKQARSRLSVREFQTIVKHIIKAIPSTVTSPPSPNSEVTEAMGLVEAYVSATVRCHNANVNTYAKADADRNKAKAALTAALAVSVPGKAEGYVLVPKNPTEKMVTVGIDARWRSAIRDGNSVREIWKAMLAVAPTDGVEHE